MEKIKIIQKIFPNPGKNPTSSSGPSDASVRVHAPHASSSPPTAHASASRMIPVPASLGPAAAPRASGRRPAPAYSPAHHPELCNASLPARSGSPGCCCTDPDRSRSSRQSPHRGCTAVCLHGREEPGEQTLHPTFSPITFPANHLDIEPSLFFPSSGSPCLKCYI